MYLSRIIYLDHNTLDYIAHISVSQQYASLSKIWRNLLSIDILLTSYRG